MNSELKYIQEWLTMATSGNFIMAESLYYEKLFPEVIDRFSRKYSPLLKGKDVLISILGFSPEPIILTAMAMKPEVHYIVTTESKGDVLKKVEDFLDNDINIIELKDTDFGTIYRALKEILYEINSSEIVIDITGGKKSMVSAASIFGKDYRCKITYVDFDEYIKDLRKPMPGSEILNIVYDPLRDQPELKY